MITQSHSFVAAALWLSACLPTFAAEVDKVMEMVNPAIVRIKVLMEEAQDGRMFKQRGFGSGAIISPDGYVLTNHHVAGRGTRFRCTPANREEIPARLIGTDVLADLAIIQLDLAARVHPETPVAVAAFGDSSPLKVGDTVYALGSAVDIQLVLAGERGGQPAAWKVTVIARAPSRDSEAEFNSWGMKSELLTVNIPT